MPGVFRVLVVEDEPRILQYIVQKISTLDERFEVAGTACNGADALMLVEELSPDVVFSDVYMPVMSGLELAAEIHERGLATRVVIISGHRDFEYAREALRAGVTDYLLKPIVDTELKAVLARMAQTLGEEQQAVEQRVILAAVMGQQDPGAASIAPGLRFLPVLLCIGNRLGVVSGISHTRVFNHIWKRPDWDKLLAGFGAPRYWVAPGWTAGQRVLVLDAGAGVPAPEQYTALMEGLAALSDGYAVNISANNEAVPLHGLNARAQELGQTLNHLQAPGHSAVFFAGDEPSDASKRLVPVTKDQLNLFRGHIQSLRYDLASRQLAELVEKWDAEKLPQRLVENGLRQLIQSLAPLRADLDHDNLYLAEYAAFTSVATGRSLADTLPEIWEVFEGLLLRQAPARDYTQNTVDDVEAYLQAHYSEELSVESVADAIGFHAVYLNRIFKRQKGVTLIQYLINLRMEKAREMIREHPDCELAFVGESVGYNDPHYFSRAFKKSTGQAPSEYRESLRGAPEGGL